MTEGDGGETGGGDEEPTIDGDDELTYADAGVDIDASEAATAALIGAVGEGRATTPACSTSATATSRWRPTGSGRSCSSPRRLATTRRWGSTASR